MNTLELVARGAAMGIASSALIDAWAFVLRRAFHVSSLDYRLLGRWIRYIPSGKFFHQRIGASPAMRGERPLGWLAHYSIGIGFALLLLLVAGEDWAESPTLLPAMAVGLGTVLAPWLVMQPAFGVGIAGSKTARPWAGRLRNLGTHAVYGLGLYTSAIMLASV